MRRTGAVLLTVRRSWIQIHQPGSFGVCPEACARSPTVHVRLTGDPKLGVTVSVNGSRSQCDPELDEVKETDRQRCGFRKNETFLHEVTTAAGGKTYSDHQLDSRGFNYIVNSGDTRL